MVKRMPLIRKQTVPDDERNLLPPPNVPLALEDIPGGEPGLLPTSALDRDLSVQVPRWNNSEPSPEWPETLTLYWDDKEVLNKEWTSPPPEEILLDVPVEHLSEEGSHKLSYFVYLSFNQTGIGSQIFTVTVDHTPPTLAIPDNRLLFPDEVLSGVTADYLENNHDRVEAEIHVYNSVNPGDVIEFYWDATPEESNPAGSKELCLDDIGLPIIVKFEGEMIRARGDGTRYAHYKVTDRAGNASSRSDPVILPVAAQPVPRDLPWPNVKDASGTAETITLDPLLTRFDGATVIIPDTADVRPLDQVKVQWAEPDAVGAYTAYAPTSPGSRQYNIPKDYIAAHIGKSIPVSYKVTDRYGEDHPSRIRSLRMLTIADHRFPIIQCEDRMGGDLPLSLVPAAGASLKLDRWLMITTDQMITVKVEGLYADGNPAQHTVLDAHRITEAELVDGIGKNDDVRIPKSFLNQLKRNFPFSILVFVSFDLGGTWPTNPNFPISRLTLVD